MSCFTCSEEDLGVTVLEFLHGHLDLVHDGVRGGDVLLLLGDGPAHLLHGLHRLLGGEDDVAVAEVSVDDPIRESLPANTDTLEHTITGQLVHDKEGVNNSGLLVIVRDNATDEAWLSGHQHVDQVIELILEVGADCLEVGHLGGSLGLDDNSLLSSPVSRGREILLLLGLSRMVRVALNHELTGFGLLEDVHHSVIDRIPVLVEPSGEVIAHGASVVYHSKMSILENIAE